MVNDEGGVKVIDPEFTIYGPPGLDVGSLLSGYVLAAVHHAFSGGADKVKALSSACRSIWDSYASAAAAGGMTLDALALAQADTVGFAMAEVCRTALGFAGGRLWLQFEDEAAKKAAIACSLGLVGKCMLGRRSDGIALLVSQLDALQASG